MYLNESACACVLGVNGINQTDAQQINDISAVLDRAYHEIWLDPFVQFLQDVLQHAVLKVVMLKQFVDAEDNGIEPVTRLRAFTKRNIAGWRLDSQLETV